MRARALLGAVVGGLGLSLVGVVPAPAQPTSRPVWTPPQVVGRDVYPTDLAMNPRGVTVISWSCENSVCLRRRTPRGALTRVVRVPVVGGGSTRASVTLDTHGTATVAYSVRRGSYPALRDGPLLVHRVSPGGVVSEPVAVEESASPTDLVASPTGDVAVRARSGDDTWMRVLADNGVVGPVVPIERDTVLEPSPDGSFWLLDRDRAGAVTVRRVAGGTVTATIPVGVSEVPADLAVRTDGTVVVAWWEGPRPERRLRTLHVAPTGTVSRVRGLTGLLLAGRELDLTALPDGRVLAAFRTGGGRRAAVRGGVVPREPGPWLRLGPALLPGYDRVVAVAHDRVVLLSLVDTWMDHHVLAQTWDGRRTSRPKRVIEAPGYDNDCGSSEITAASAGGHVALVNRRGHACRPRYDKVVLTYRR
ncbi:hypothetical protein [Nocardioides deserti]|uniref:Uncharacterized protein n=1 Tax=Nocardioides deserti TaxID=1588644 RepID=A0ABR6U7F6_9ACTN|nr:hypothetical protein [Nocardioides deserti]MBC2960320.1 hypothetical protein [Nocardioides deserti]GGO71743.1 hypothetical protein GCM10012276_13450 [Nocardioides deserti]